MADQAGSRCRWPMKFRMVPVQIADNVAELSSAHSRQSSGGLRYKNLPRSSKLLGITHEFIFFSLSLSFIFPLSLSLFLSLYIFENLLSFNVIFPLSRQPSSSFFSTCRRL